MRLNGIRSLWVIAAAVTLLAGGPLHVVAQSMDGTGLVATGLLLRQMEGVKRVLMVGAHPDDEDTPMLTVLARGHGAETAYLSLTRGDGGQNLIGPELWEGLGIIRTGELEAARELDGGEQFFTRAFDFGYSKSSDEALSLWPRDQILSDAVFVIRKYRPHVIVSVWSGTPADGHGHHQASGILTREAFEAAGDPTRFPEHFAQGVEAWRPGKLYLSSRRRGGGADAQSSVLFHVGEIDPLLGRSTLQLSALSRSQHRSQDMGSAQTLGPRMAGANFIAGHVEGPDDEMFGGIDTTLVGLASNFDDDVAREVIVHLEAYRRDVAIARATLGLTPAEVVPRLASALRHLGQASNVGGSSDREFREVMAQKKTVATRALMAAAGIVLDIRSGDDLIVPGQTVEVRAQLWNGSPFSLWLPEVELLTAVARTVSEVAVEGLDEDGRVAAGTLATWRYEVRIPGNEAPSRLYFLESERPGTYYDWPEAFDNWGLPRNGPTLEGRARFSLLDGDDPVGAQVEATTPWRFVGVNQARGEFVKPVLVVPAVSLQVTPGGLAWPQSRTEPQTVTVLVRTEAGEGASGDLTLSAPEGWTVTPASQRFALASAGAERSVSFEVRPNGAPAPGEHVIRAVAATDRSMSYSEGYTLIDYEHVERALLYTEAVTSLTVVPATVREGVRVGYIMGTGDDGPTAIRQMGGSVELLSEAQVRDGAFGDFDVIVLGVRAYEARPDVRAANDQIVDFARGGGTVITQYNQYQFSSGGYAPYELTIGRPAPRVADETATVTVLEPGSPLFTTPNQITQDDFDGWVQERGLYFASEWGEEYTPMIELNDPGEPARQGALLVASVGEGVYVYAALSFFRQWAGRVPGAYRLFANLVSLDAQEWGEFVERR